MKAKSGERLLLRRNGHGQRLQDHINCVREELAPPCGEDCRRNAVGDLRLRRRSQHAVRFRSVVTGVDARRRGEVPRSELCDRRGDNGIGCQSDERRIGAGSLRIGHRFEDERNEDFGVDEHRAPREPVPGARCVRQRARDVTARE